MKTNNSFSQNSFEQPVIKIKENGHLSIRGNSISLWPEHSFKPIINWVNRYQGDALRMDIDLNFTNCSSVKLLIKTIMTADKNQRIKEKSIAWFFKDKEGLEMGEMIAAMVKSTKFKLYSKN